MISISVKTYGESNTPENIAAKSIAKCFEGLPQDIVGTVLIASNVTLPGGYDIKDIDILVIGKLKNFSLHLNCPAKISETEMEDTSDRDVFINSFCYIVELKDHNAESVRRDGLSDLQVKYNSHWHSATEQSLKQQYSFVNFLRQEWGCAPYVRNVIWLRQLREYEYTQLFSESNVNIFFGKVSLEKFFSAAILSSQAERYPFKTKSGRYVVNDFYGDSKEIKEDDFLKILDIFLKQKNACGELTRKKLEILTRDYVRDHLPESIGDKLTILEGRAGTGKTLKLIQIAFKLAYEKGARCLLLTYNHALVSDIKRVLAFSGMPDGIDSHTVQIQTLHSFFFELFNGFGIHKGGLVPNQNFDSNYNQYLQNLLQKLYENKNVEFPLVKSCEAVCWDYILIDEAQDWSETEKQILFYLFGKERIIVADGVDQFMRSNSKIQWEKGMGKEEIIQQRSTQGLRQKYNLSIFVNGFAKECGLDWRVEPNEDLPGGRVKIYGKYNSTIHQELKSNCEKSECVNYDILILVPPTEVEHNANKSYFKKADNYKKANIDIYDGTNSDNRMAYPVKDECRLFQYHSCRGLEGWCVVCDEFDDVIEWQLQHCEVHDDDLLFDKELIKWNKTMQWTLMPLTRSIDTLVITLKNPENRIGKMLKQLAKKYSDFVEWNIN